MNNTDKLRAILAYDTLHLLNNEGRQHRKDVLNYLKNKYENPESDLEKAVKEDIIKNGGHEYYTVPIAEADWLVKKDGGKPGFWSISEEGKQALKDYPDAERLYKKAIEIYNTWIEGKKETPKRGNISFSIQALLLKETLEYLVNNSESKREDVLKHLRELFLNQEKDLNDDEKKKYQVEIDNDFFSIYPTGAGFIQKKQRGFWSISEEGKKALEDYPDAENLYEKAIEIYNDKKKDKPGDINNPENTSTEPAITKKITEPPEKLKPYIHALKKKKQIILYGAPGTGKTYNAKKIAGYFTNNDDSRLKIVQFHPSFCYEDFMSGLRPVEKDGKLSYRFIDGVFLSFCKEAQNDTSNDYVIIIDEINRGNIPQIFGELMYALEYRDEKITLQNGETFIIPHNLYIIGTMNTADRSIALMDFALRRRFGFFRIDPDYEALKEFHKDNKSIDCEKLKSILVEINKGIEDKDFYIGTSFFMKENITQEELENIYKCEIYPYLEEYFYGKNLKAEEYTFDKIKPKIQACFKCKSETVEATQDSDAESDSPDSHQEEEETNTDKA